MSDYLKDPDFTDPACVAAWEELVDELACHEMSPVEAERTWLEISGVLVLARLQLGLVAAAERRPSLSDALRRWPTARSGSRWRRGEHGS